MSVGNLALKAALAASVMVMPVAVQASAAQSLSLNSASVARAGAAQQDANEMGGGFIIPLLALGAVILGILVLIDDEEDAVSP